MTALPTGYRRDPVPTEKTEIKTKTRNGPQERNGKISNFPEGSTVEMRKTPLNAFHHASGGKMVDFNGWEMPIQYDGLIKEHLRTRNGVSLFDVCHMGIVNLEGRDALANVQRLTTNDASSLAVGQVQLSAMLYPDGTIVDDLTVYRLGEKKYRLCVNAANTDRDFKWIASHIDGELTCENASSVTGQIAIQGRHSEKILQRIAKHALQEIRYYWCAETEILGIPALIARMGYTGEDGFELFCSQGDTETIWNGLLSVGKSFGIAPAGLGARDTLRTEMCYRLYGNDIDDRHNVLESALGWIVKMDSSDFIGKEALRRIKERGIERKLVPFLLAERGVPRKGYRILNESGKTEIGVVTSGTSSPVLKQGIGMGYVKRGHFTKGTAINVRIREKSVPATVVKAPFVNVGK